jgi:GT2 family glycosyltransferase
VPKGKVCVAIVTHNSARYIRRCLQAVLLQEGVEIELVVVDNASGDETRDLLREFAGRIRIILNPSNVGFAAGQNQAIRAGKAPWVLTLNPDVLMPSDFIRKLVEAGESDRRAGTVCGKLLSIGPGFEPFSEPRIDSTGIYFTPAMRHFDRGWREPDTRYFERMEYVFGATAAAALFRRAMIDDVSVEGHFFDPDFFVYREDADVAWRAQLLGWRCLYTPAAVAHHVRTVTHLNRRSVPALLNMHSVKNRFLMRIKNSTAGIWRECWASMLFRDAVVIGGTLLWEPSSLPAFYHLLRCLPRAMRQRRIILGRRRASDEDLAGWFSNSPVAHPVGRVLEIPVRKEWPVAPKAAAL